MLHLFYQLICLQTYHFLATHQKNKENYKKNGPKIAILDFGIKDIVEPPKKTCLLLKFSRPLSNTLEIAINITEISSKIVELDIYKEITRNYIPVTYWNEVIRIELDMLYLNNTKKFVNLFDRHKAIGSK